MLDQWQIDDKIIGLVNIFHIENPDVTLSVSQIEGVYIVTLDYDFTNLPHDIQKRGRESINTLMTAIKMLKISAIFQMGHVK